MTQMERKVSWLTGRMDGGMKFYHTHEPIAHQVDGLSQRTQVFNESVPHGWTQQTGKTDAEVTMRHPDFEVS